MRNKILIAIALMLLLIVGSVILVVMSLAEDGKLKNALREAGFEEVSQAVYTDRPLASGQVITAQDVYENEISIDDARAEVVMCKDDVIGKRTVGAMEGCAPLTVQDVGLRREDVLNNELDRLKKIGAKTHGICAHKSDTKIRAPQKFVFRVNRDVPEGERIKASDIDTLPAAEHDTKNCIGDIRLVINHMAKYGMEKDQLLHPHNLVTVGEYEEDAFVATRDLKPGDIVSAADIAKKHFEKNKCSVNAILEQSLIEGSKVVQPIAKDQVFRVIDLQAAASK
ncbi:MAG: flagella basal body P-ring formation protein FlgA [Cyanobacteria bacterium TGS_CYA1]|nr:flagella basal body P-ring formation protein FlgA [Cyanobacteria bacterium TGS_CYA1]